MPRSPPPLAPPPPRPPSSRRRSSGEPVDLHTSTAHRTAHTARGSSPGSCLVVVLRFGPSALLDLLSVAGLARDDLDSRGSDHLGADSLAGGHRTATPPRHLATSPSRHLANTPIRQHANTLTRHHEGQTRYLGTKGRWMRTRRCEVEDARLDIGVTVQHSRRPGAFHLELRVLDHEGPHIVT
jgi:hypothetical protein